MWPRRWRSICDERGADTGLRLSAQRALIGAVTPGLRSFSIELKADVVRTMAVYEAEPSEIERDLIAAAATEIMADNTVEMLDEQIVVSLSKPPQRLAHVVFERYEPQD